MGWEAVAGEAVAGGGGAGKAVVGGAVAGKAVAGEVVVGGAVAGDAVGEEAVDGWEHSQNHSPENLPTVDIINNPVYK